jgi:prepilin-type N-terminal cleavage/methylation domain-containing protein
MEGMTRTIEYQARSQRGFTLVDTMVTLSIIGIVGSMATMQIGTVRQSMQGDSAMRLVMAQLNSAREMAITQRRNMEVRFVGSNGLQIIRSDVPTGTTVLADVAFESNARYSLPAGIPDTSDGFGNSSAISFGSALKVMFGPNGTLIDNNGDPINGTVTVSIADIPASVRAVTILGATGRVHGYRWNGVVWRRV